VAHRGVGLLVGTGLGVDQVSEFLEFRTVALLVSCGILVAASCISVAMIFLLVIF
jgi:hypothetical protein